MMSQQDRATTSSKTTPSKARRGRGKWVLLIFLLLAIATYIVQRGAESEPQDQPLITVVERGDIENTISSAGSLKPSEYVDVGAQVSGQLEILHVEVGDIVEAEQLLAEIDARTQESRVDASRSALEALEAQVGSRQASLDLARANATRQERLMAANATSQQDYDTAIANLASAEASLTQLQKQISQSRSSLSTEETELEYARIYAPMAGTIVSIEMNEGRTLNANQQAPTILRIADLSTMTVETQISEADVGSIHPGMDIYFTTLSGGNRRWFGKLRQILPTPVVENNVVLYTGLFDVDNADGTLLPEMTAQVFFITASARDVLTVPVGALSFAPPAMPAGSGASVGVAATTGATPSRIPTNLPASAMSRRGNELQSFAHRNATVEVIAADGTRQQRDVVIGVTSRVSAEVISGLQAGEQVVAGIIQGSSDEQTQRSGPRGGFGGFR